VTADLVTELARRQGIHLKVEIAPYTRAYRAVQVSQGVIAAQIGRTSARELKFSWIVPLFQEPFMVHVRGDGQVDPDIVAHGSPGAVGVLRDGLADDLARELGITPLEEATDELTNARKLTVGHISAWLASKNSAKFAMRQAGLNSADLVRGRVLRTYPLYLVAAPGYSSADTLRWVQAFEEVKADGTYQHILERYGYEQ
jgi:polar amino acid transport system substrate-binding protein